MAVVDRCRRGRSRFAVGNPKGHADVVGGEFERQRTNGRRRSVLDDEDYRIVVQVFKVSVRAAPGVVFGRPAQCLTGAHACGNLLGMMDDEHGETMAPLRLATQKRKQRRKLAADVLVYPVEAHERIENQEARSHVWRTLIAPGAAQQPAP